MNTMAKAIVEFIIHLYMIPIALVVIKLYSNSLFNIVICPKRYGIQNAT